MPTPQELLNKYLHAGQVLSGRYQLEKVIGGGAYGAIYLASDLISHEYVAVKALPPNAESGSKTALGRFQREMKIIHNLVHPNIVALYDFGETEQHIPYMVLEYIQGDTLESVARDNPMNLEDGLDVLVQILSALGAAHAQGIIHRDLKPANIMLQGRSVGYDVKILDFGMAKLLSRLGDESIIQLTREGVAVGTPRYIAPEQARGLEVGPYTDLYAVGLLTYEIFAGARAVKADSIEGAVMAHVSPDALELDELHLVPESVRPIMFKLLAKKVPKRYQRAAEVIDDIERLRARLRKEKRGEIPRHVDASGKPIASPPELDLDYQHVDQIEEERLGRLRRQQAPPLRVSQGIWRPATSGMEYVERALAPVAVLFGFMLFSTHFDSAYPVRVAIGLAPVAFGALLGWFMWPREKWFTMTRGIIFAAVSSGIFGHLLGRQKLLTELLRDPVWFLQPFWEVPGVQAVAGVLIDIAHKYAFFLSGIQ